MSFDLERILESKRALRRNLATRSVAEKLRMLDDLRQRQLDIRNATVPESSTVREKPTKYRSSKNG